MGGLASEPGAQMLLMSGESDVFLSCLHWCDGVGCCVVVGWAACDARPEGSACWCVKPCGLRMQYINKSTPYVVCPPMSVHCSLVMFTHGGTASRMLGIGSNARDRCLQPTL